MIRVEARKQVWRLRTYVGMGLVVLIPLIFTATFKANPPKGAGSFFALSTSSALNVSITALTAVSAFLLIVVVSLFAGETVAGEAEWGTLRYLLVRPVTRNRLLGAKLAVTVALALTATFLVSIVGLVGGSIAFGWHAVHTPTLQTISMGSAVGKLALGTLYVAWSQAAYISFAFMLSTMTDKTFAAVAGGVGLGVVSQILNNIAALNGTSYIYPTHYLNAWQALFLSPVPVGSIVRGILLQVPYVVIFLAVAWWWFNRKDILS
jgi:ABC-2 type transport system permease protein